MSDVTGQARGAARAAQPEPARPRLSEPAGCPQPGEPSERPRRGRPRRPFTPTQEELLRHLAGETVLHGGCCSSKRELAALAHCSVKTIDRCLRDLRRRGLVSVEMRFDEHGSQLPSRYRVVAAADP